MSQKAASTTKSCLMLVLAALFTATLTVAFVDPHQYHEGNYGTAGLPRTDLDNSRGTWDYTNLNKWPRLCLQGSRQSPISFTNVDPSEIIKDPALQRLQFSSKCFFPKEETEMRIVNEGAVNTVSFERQGRLPEDLSECTVVDPLDKNRRYYFSELHFHATSEHKFRTLRPDVEMHLTFITDEVKQKNRQVLVVAVMLKASNTANSTSVRALRHILVDGSLPRRHAMTTCFLTEDLSITSLLPSRESYLLYDGSDTHPPCRENVRWVVMTSPVFISRIAVGKLRDAMDQLMPNNFHRYGNVRPPQALNGRRIYRFDDTSVPQGNRSRREGTLADVWDAKKTNHSYIMDDVALDQQEGGAYLAMKEATAAAPSVEETTTTTMIPSTRPIPNPEVVYDAAGSASRHVFASSASSASTSSRSETAASTEPTKNASFFSSAVPTTDKAASEEAGNATTTTTTAPAAPGSGASEDNAAAKPNDGAATTSASNFKLASTTTTTAEPKDNASDSTTITTATSVATSSSSSSAAPVNTMTPTPSRKPNKDSKSHGGASKNVSDAAGEAKLFEDNASATTKGAWARFKKSVANATNTAAQHPAETAIMAAVLIILVYLVYTCVRGWKTPVYVVGIDPSELRPLNANSPFGQYGGTNSDAAAAVRPAKE